MLAAALASAALAAAAPAAGDAVAPAAAVAPARRRPQRRLERFAPVVVHASGEPSLLTGVAAFAGRVPGVPRRRPRPALYARRAAGWSQYWLLFAGEEQDRGPFRGGSHDGDWELVQVRVVRGEVVEAVVSQHGDAERCGPPALRRRRGGRPPAPRAPGGAAAGHRPRRRLRPVVFVARGSHALYFARGLRDRTFPEPNDEADGRGPAMRPRVVRIGGRGPAWLRHAGGWGVPRGPAFHPAWRDPAGWAASAGPCLARRCNERGECDQPETLMAAALAGGGLLAAAGLARRRVRRHPASSRNGEAAAAPLA